MTFPAQLPEPPYCVVIFPSVRTGVDAEDYGTMAETMVALAAEQPGFLGIESVRNGEGRGITLSYWTDEAAIAAWKKNAAHKEAQKKGRADWYERFAIRVARVERAHSFSRE